MDHQYHQEKPKAEFKTSVVTRSLINETPTYFMEHLFESPKNVLLTADVIYHHAPLARSPSAGCDVLSVRLFAEDGRPPLKPAHRGAGGL